MDDVTYQVLSEMELSQVHVIALAEFEKDDPLLLEAKQNRSLIEYYFTCTPSLPIYILDRAPEVDIITYLDADMYFFSPIEPIYQILGVESVLIIGHRFSPALKNCEIFGIYNVGLLAFRRDSNGLACLRWWRDRCLEWCYDRVEDGKFADQKYLDDWPERFAGVTISHHKGIGLAPWNLANYNYFSKNEGILVDEYPLIVYHFHGLKRVNQRLYDTDISAYKARLPEVLRRDLYQPYIMELERIRQDLEAFMGFGSDQTHSIRASVSADASIWMKFAFSIINGITRLKFFQKLVCNDLIAFDQESDFRALRTK